jgi:filamentous hemagglutinin
MMLPNAENLVVEEEKIVGYLLNTSHRYGASKARFFAAFGFQVKGWESLARALREHGQRYEVTRAKDTAFGPRYEIEGPLPAPDGRSPNVCTVWQLDRGALAPRLITAYPLEEVES